MGQNSFSKAERLLKSKDFIVVRKTGKRFAAKNFIIFLKENNIGMRRFALAVGARVGGAVKRNRIKRLFREFFRLNKEMFPPSSDIFISVREGFNLLKYGEVEKEMRSVIPDLKQKFEK